ncbi:MAG: chemotaxis protein CheA [Pseudomonadota bacterium]
MDEMEEFLTIFFQECEERLSELQDCLSLMVEGDFDAETLNAAFRAVHSVKGGAGAFGLDDLVEFTHIFETTMDALRSDKLEANEKVCQVLLRASDMMSALIEDAQGNGDGFDRQQADLLMGELAELAGVEPPRPTPSGDAEAAPAPAAKAEAAPSEPAAEELLEEDNERDVVITLRPGPDFMRSGHDPLKFIRALRQFGAVSVEVLGEHPQLDHFDPLETTLGWRVSLCTDVEPGELDSFLFMYTLAADVTVEDPGLGADQAEASPADADGDASEPEATEAASTPDTAPEAEPSEAAEAQSEPKSSPKPEPAPKAEAKPDAKDGSSAPKRAQAPVSKALRVELNRIDRLVNMVGEIVITQAVLSQNFTELETSNDIQFAHAVEALSRQVRELQESVMAIRAQPVKAVFSRMPRVVRDLCASLDKEARIILSGEHTEVDTTVIEELSEPLTHMLRNSMDHGVEGPDERVAKGKPRCGTINLSAEHRGERVRIVISDDGAGINRERVLQKAIDKGIVPAEATLSDEEIDMLIFHPGFSTASTVTNVSGRGVGMDVVKKKVQALGGRVVVTSTPGEGAVFTITLPLTLAVLDGMTIGVGSERFILPLGSIVEAVKIDQNSIDVLPGEVRVLRYRGEWLPMICLRQALNLETAQGSEELVVVVETETEGRVAIIVDELLGQRQVVLKSLEANFQRVDGVSGATILGDGRVALILDIPALQNLAGGYTGGMGGFGSDMGVAAFADADADADAGAEMTF